MSQIPKNKEQAILEAAEREFLAKGFDQARTTSIAEAAGVTHAMLHYYFRTKENIFERILDEKMHLMEQSVVEAFGKPKQTMLERLKKGISSHFDFLAANPDLPRFIVNEVISNPERYAMMREKVVPLVTALMGEVQSELNTLADRGEIERIDVRQLVLDILSLNIFIFITYPILEPVLLNGEDRETFLRRRKEENIEMILRRLKKM